MKIIPLSEGAFTIDKTKVFVPFDETKDIFKERPVGSLLVEVQPFLVITANDMLLLDTGLGFINENGVPQIHQLLMDQGINPSEITKVLLSHLHKDHSGGVGISSTNKSGPSATDKSNNPGTSEFSSSNGSDYSNENKPASAISNKLSFPGAKYYVQRRELEFALNDTSASYIKEDLFCLKDAEQVVLLDGDGVINEDGSIETNGATGGYIHFEMTSAHSRYHQVFKITENEKIIFFGGDDAPQYQQMKSKYVAKYDFDGKKCMQLRQQWWAEGNKEHWMFLFYHDIKTPVITL